MERHPHETKLNATAFDILSAIERGFRAQVDVKGKLAELFMSRQFEKLREQGAIDGFVWQDIDGQPDFIVTYRGHELVVECKNIRNQTYKRPTCLAQVRRLKSTPKRPFTSDPPPKE